MVGRTTLSNWAGYKNYGGRGIKVCPRWRSFENFADDMGSTFRPELSLERIDVNGDYEPGNCRWATRKEQHRNKRNTRQVAWLGRTLTVGEWSEILGVNASTIGVRLWRGWSVERSLTTGADSELVASLVASAGSRTE
ncbi:hypothetical protein [Micromonospora sediminicola]|uniref:hypothetical protein n=1 Tax=Micromonospora sediminicola TaxID=946078 RepID=UPI0037BE1AB5